PLFLRVRHLNPVDSDRVTPLVQTEHRLGRRPWFLAVAALPLFTGAMAYQVSRNPALEAPASIDRTELAAVAEAPATVAAQPGPESIELTVRPNDTLDGLFRAAGLDLA